MLSNVFFSCRNYLLSCLYIGSCSPFISPSSQCIWNERLTLLYNLNANLAYMIFPPYLWFASYVKFNKDNFLNLGWKFYWMKISIEKKVHSKNKIMKQKLKYLINLQHRKERVKYSVYSNKTPPKSCIYRDPLCACKTSTESWIHRDVLSVWMYWSGENSCTGRPDIGVCDVWIRSVDVETEDHGVRVGQRRGRDVIKLPHLKQITRSIAFSPFLWGDQNVGLKLHTLSASATTATTPDSVLYINGSQTFC